MRLRSSEAERRQAAQDIRSTEDIVIELLRNARDAQASAIYLALQREGDTRSIVMIDDGCGIPASLHERIFEPRVTSKLDTAHMDKWGMHGRGMALYSISVNTQVHRVVRSEVGKGSALAFESNLRSLPEKTDQSSFPRFELQENGSYAMRGPKNILRTAAEFALEHRGVCEVYCGSYSEVISTLYAKGLTLTTPSQRAFGSPAEYASFADMLAYAADSEELARMAASLGLEISERTCHRILQGEVSPLPSLLDRIRSESFVKEAKDTSKPVPPKDARGLKLARQDLDSLSRAASQAFQELAEAYYLEPNVEPRVRVGSQAITITIPVEKLR